MQTPIAQPITLEVNARTDELLPACTYANGQLTSDAPGDYSPDGLVIDPTKQQLIMVSFDEAAPDLRNGVYVPIQKGTPSLPFIWERYIGADESFELQDGLVVRILGGKRYYQREYRLAFSGALDLGVTPLSWIFTGPSLLTIHKTPQCSVPLNARYSHVGNFPATYNTANQVLTGTANGQLIPDGIPVTLLEGPTYLVLADQINKNENGYWAVAAPGDPDNPPILVRVSWHEANTEIMPGQRYLVTDGATRAGSQYMITGYQPFSQIGVDPINLVLM